MNTIIKLFAIAFFIAAIGLLMHKANAGIYMEKENKQVLESQTTELIKTCAFVFDVEHSYDKKEHKTISNTTNAIFCENMIDTVYYECTNNYHDYCWLKPYWTNYDRQQFVNPEFCKVVDC